MTANACRTYVSAGPVEATVLGNIAVQLMAAGEIKDLKDARKIINNSQKIDRYSPKDTMLWERAYERFNKIIKAKEVVS